MTLYMTHDTLDDDTLHDTLHSTWHSRRNRLYLLERITGWRRPIGCLKTSLNCRSVFAKEPLITGLCCEQTYQQGILLVLATLCKDAIRVIQTQRNKKRNQLHSQQSWRWQFPWAQVSAETNNKRRDSGNTHNTNERKKPTSFSTVLMMAISMCTGISLHTIDTGCRKLIACLKLLVIFRERATNSRALLREMTYENKASYDSTPPCRWLPNGFCHGKFLGHRHFLKDNRNAAFKGYRYTHRKKARHESPPEWSVWLEFPWA